MKSPQIAAATPVVAMVFVLAIAAAAALPVRAADAPTPAATPPSPTSAAPAAKPKRAATPAEAAVAVVNGTPIPRSEFEYYVKSTTGKNASDLAPELKGQLLDNLIRAEVLKQQAQKDGMDKTPDIVSQLALTRLQVLDEAAANVYLKDKPPTDAQLHAEYDAQIAALPKTEYHARHILVASQGEAQVIIDQLKGGASFEELAKTKSIDSSKDQGGDLGWFPASQMVKPFSDAVMGLKKGETTSAPVQTPFGWHVIELLDTREQPPPQFDSVKQRVQQLVQAKKVREYQEQLVKTSTVQKNL
jgi:peptidyl-prolyl cis-trans isomerase C